MTEYMITFYLFMTNRNGTQITMTRKISECPWAWFKRDAWKELDEEDWAGCIVTMVHEIAPKSNLKERLPFA